MQLPRFLPRTRRTRANASVRSARLQVESLESRELLSATLVRDIFGGPTSSTPQQLTAVGDTVFFIAADASHGRELWKSDGSTEQTRMVADLAPGSASSNPSRLTAAGDDLYFTRRDGFELWILRGGSSTPERVVSLDPYAVTELAAVGDVLYFTAAPPSGLDAAKLQLWRVVDGQASILRSDLKRNLVGENLTPFGQSLLFTAVGRDGVGDVPPTFDTQYLYRVDGQVRAVYWVGLGYPIDHLTVAGSTVYFVRGCYDHGQVCVWKSDNLDENPVFAPDFAASIHFAGRPANLTAVGERLFFTHKELLSNGTLTGEHRELWTVDPQFARSECIVGCDQAMPMRVGSSLISFGGALYFIARAEGGSYRLWRSDGTKEGTVALTGEFGTSVANAPSLFTVLDDTLYFRAGSGLGLWSYRVGDAGPQRVENLLGVEDIEVAGGMLYLSASSLNHGRELWIVSDRPDLKATALAWENFVEGRDVRFGYDVAAEESFPDTQISFYWSTSRDPADRIGDTPIYTYRLDTDETKGPGSFSDLEILASALGTPAADSGATHLVMMIDPLRTVRESNEQNNSRSMSLCPVEDLVKPHVDSDPINRSDLHPELRAAVDRFEQLIRDELGNENFELPITSIYRSPAVRDHFVELRDKFSALDALDGIDLVRIAGEVAKPPQLELSANAHPFSRACGELLREVNEEVASHGLQWSSRSNRLAVADRSLHTRSQGDVRALDISMNSLAARSLSASEVDELARAAGLYRPHPVGDPPHFQLLQTPEAVGPLFEPREEFLVPSTGKRRVLFDAMDGSSARLAVSFSSPTGAVLWSGQANQDAGPFTLTESGNYVVSIERASTIQSVARNANQSDLESLDEYHFRIADVDDAKPIARGTIHTATVQPDLSAAMFTFDAAAGETIVVEDLGGAGRLNWMLYGPNNALVSSKTAGSQFGAYLGESGTYLVTVSGAVEAATFPRLRVGPYVPTPATPPGPTLDWVRYFDDPTGGETGGPIAFDAAGNIWTSNNWNAFHGGTRLLKLSPAGEILQAIRLDEDGEVLITDITFDAAGNVIVVGNTRSPTLLNRLNELSAGLDPVFNGLMSDGFVTKVTPTGVVQWSRYMGDEGSRGDSVSAVVATATGELRVVGIISASQTPGQVARPGGYVASLSAAGALQWTVFLGDDSIWIDDIALSVSGDSVVVGKSQNELPRATNSHHFVRDTYTDYDAFVSRISPSGSVLWSTYLGANKLNAFDFEVAIDSGGNIYAVGETEYATLEKAKNSIHGELHYTGAETYRGGDTFITRLESNGSIVWSRYVGGELEDMRPVGLLADRLGRVWFAGSTISREFEGRVNAIHNLESYNNFLDAFVARVAPNGDEPWVMYLGGTVHDEARGLAFDRSGNIVVTGTTRSYDFEHAENELGEEGDGNIAVADVFFARIRDAVSEIHGHVWHDGNSDGARRPGEPAPPGTTVYLDHNGSGTLDFAPVTRKLVFEATDVPQALRGPGSLASHIQVSGVRGTIADLNVGLVLNPVSAVQSIYLRFGPELIKLSGANLNAFSTEVLVDASLDDEALQPFRANFFSADQLLGRFRPDEPLDAFDGLSPNGTWSLQMYSPYLFDDLRVRVHRWFIELTVVENEFEPTVSTNSAGEFAFTGLAAGDYTVRELVPPAGFPAAWRRVRLSASQSALNVDLDNRPNQPPALSPVPKQTIVKGRTLHVTVQASDPDGDPLSFSLGSDAPAGAEIEPASGVFTWTPPADPASIGTHSVTVFVSDGGTVTRQTTFIVEVLERDTVKPRVERTQLFRIEDPQLPPYSALEVVFSEPLDPASITDLTDYRVRLPQARVGAVAVALAELRSPSTLFLTLGQLVPPGEMVELWINGSGGPTDRDGHSLDGGDYKVILGAGSRLTYIDPIDGDSISLKLSGGGFIRLSLTESAALELVGVGPSSTLTGSVKANRRGGGDGRALLGSIRADGELRIALPSQFAMDSSVVELSRASVRAVEDRGQVVLTVVRSGETASTVTVSYSVTGSSATAGSDFEPSGGTVTFGPGEKRKDITISLIDDDALEGDELFYVSLGSVTGRATVGAIAQTEITLIDDEDPAADWVGPSIDRVTWDATAKRITWIDVTFNEGVDPASATRVSHYTLSVLGRRPKAIAIRQVQLIANDTVRIELVGRLSQGRAFELLAHDTITDLAENPLVNGSFRSLPQD